MFDLRFSRKPARHSPDAPILNASNLNVRYDGQVVLDGVSFRLARGEQVAVVGPNGAGKSTLFKVVAGVLTPSDGEIQVAGQEPGGHICIAYVPQRSEVDWNFPVTVADVVMMGRIGKLGLLRHASRRDWEFVHRCLEVVGLSELARRQIGELSGGQQQRMFIARALAQEAELMLMDEPLTGLDVPSQEGIFHILDALRNLRVTLMIATHDLNMAAKRFDRVMLLNKKMFGFGLADKVFAPQNLQAAYGGHLRFVQGEDGLLVLSDTCCGGDHG